MKKKLNLKNLKLSSFRTSNASQLKKVQGGHSNDNTYCVNCDGHCFRAETCACETEVGSCTC